MARIRFGVISSLLLKNPVVQGREDNLPALGAGLSVQFWGA